MAEVKQIIRVINTDIAGNTKLFFALKKIYGVSYNFSNAVCAYLNLDKLRPVGSLTEEEVKNIEDVIKNPLKHNFPTFMLNRRKDIETGEDKHLLGSDLKLRKEFDIKRLKNTRAYKGIRHALGLPVRGQSTRSHFHKGKSLGVEKPKKTKKG